MTNSTTISRDFDPALDLILERIVDVPREKVWKAWTEPEHLKKWFTPKPWTTSECEIDLRPGGILRVVMRSPEGDEFPNIGCYLEIVENERLTWTVALGPGFRPSNRQSDVPIFTAVILLEPHGAGTKYTAWLMHRDPDNRDAHDKMGFLDGWGTTLDQLVEMAKSMP